MGNSTTVQKEKTLMSVNPESLISQAIQKNVPIETMERLLAMRRELKEEWAREEYFKALSIFQQACPSIPKKKEVHDGNGKLRYKYAPLDVIVETIKTSERINGFSHTIQTRQEKDCVTAICTIHHKAGHSESSEFTIPIDPKAYMNAAQKVASALTYAKRYAFNNAFGIMTTDEDNDANSLDEKPEMEMQKNNNDGKPKTETQNNTVQHSIREYYEHAVIGLGALIDEKLIDQDGYDVGLYELKRLLKAGDKKVMIKEYLRLKKKYTDHLPNDPKIETAETIWELCIEKIDQMFNEKLIDAEWQTNEIEYLQPKKGNIVELKSRLELIGAEYKKLKKMKNESFPSHIRSLAHIFKKGNG